MADELRNIVGVSWQEEEAVRTTVAAQIAATSGKEAREEAAQRVRLQGAISLAESALDAAHEKLDEATADHEAAAAKGGQGAKVKQEGLEAARSELKRAKAQLQRELSALKAHDLQAQRDLAQRQQQALREAEAAQATAAAGSAPRNIHEQRMLERDAMLVGLGTHRMSSTGVPLPTSRSADDIAELKQSVEALRTRQPAADVRLLQSSGHQSIRPMPSLRTGNSVLPAHYRATANATSANRVGRPPASSGASGPSSGATDAVLDYRGGDTVLPSVHQVTVSRADRTRHRYTRARDDGDIHAFNERQQRMARGGGGGERRKRARREKKEEEGEEDDKKKDERKRRRRDQQQQQQRLFDSETDNDWQSSSTTSSGSSDKDSTSDDDALLIDRFARRATKDDDDDDDGSEFTTSSEDDDNEDDDDADGAPAAPAPNVQILPQVAAHIVCPQDVWEALLGYQQVGVRWLTELHLRGTGGILGDEMGLGKTIQTAALLNVVATSRLFDGGSAKPSLIVAPLTVVQQWVAELHKWAPALRVVVLHSSGSAVESRESVIASVRGTASVVLTTYAAVTQHLQLLHSADFGYVVLDEGHKIANPEAAVTVACKTFRTRHRIVLSGSPIQNTLKELWSIFDFVAPGILGTLGTFTNEIETPIRVSRSPQASGAELQTAIECAKALREHIGPFLLRRLKRDVNKMLPPKHERVIRCTLTNQQLQEYLNVLASSDVQDVLGRQIETRMQLGELDRNNRSSLTGGLASNTSRNHLSRGMAFKAFKSLSDLRLMCNHVDIYRVRADDQAEGGRGKTHLRSNREVNLAGSGKLQALKQLMRQWHTDGNKALVFSQSTKMLDIIENLVDQEEYAYVRMDGKTPSRDRGVLIDRFNHSPEIFVALLTTRVGGLGVNLTGANRVVIYDPDWNPVTDEQARERAWRIGQTREVCVYRMITSGTVEEHILHRQLAKTYVTEKVLVDPTLQRFFSVQSLASAFKLGDEYVPRVGAAARPYVAEAIDAGTLSSEISGSYGEATAAAAALKLESEAKLVEKSSTKREESRGTEAGCPILLDDDDDDGDKAADTKTKVKVERQESAELATFQEAVLVDGNKKEEEDRKVGHTTTTNNNQQQQQETSLLASLCDGERMSQATTDPMALQLAKLSARRTIQRATQPPPPERMRQMYTRPTINTQQQQQPTQAAAAALLPPTVPLSATMVVEGANGAMEPPLSQRSRTQPTAKLPPAASVRKIPLNRPPAPKPSTTHRTQ